AVAPGPGTGAQTTPGNLHLGGGLTMAAGTYVWELSALTVAGPGTNYDQITLTGGASVLGGVSQVTLDFGLLPAGQDANGADPFWTTAHSWTIVALSGGTFARPFRPLPHPHLSPRH